MTPSDDPFDLERFVSAQRASYETALAEIERGAKRTHWMWYIFPQLAGLGHSAIAKRYAIRSLAEARAYLVHPVLGKQYAACVDALQGLSETTAEQVFGGIDALKLRSSLTLFAIAGDEPRYRAALERWYGGPDPATIAGLGR